MFVVVSFWRIIKCTIRFTLLSTPTNLKVRAF